MREKSSEELGTMPKNNLREITLGARPPGSHSPTSVFSSLSINLTDARKGSFDYLEKRRAFHIKTLASLGNCNLSGSLINFLFNSWKIRAARRAHNLTHQLETQFPS